MKCYLLPALSVIALVSCAQHPANEHNAEKSKLPVSPAASSASGRTLFLKNCMHCHGADARGDEGPDLHKLDWPDEQITARIRNGKQGQMPSFAGKFSPEQISELTAYLRTLR